MSVFKKTSLFVSLLTWRIALLLIVKHLLVLNVFWYNHSSEAEMEKNEQEVG
jgi:hypothetical protein